MNDGAVKYRTRFRCIRCKTPYMNEQFLAYHIVLTHIEPWRTAL